MPQPLFAEDEDGETYVDLEMIMSPIIAAHDGLSVCIFDNDERLWIKVSAAKQWVEAELFLDVSRKYKKHLELLLAVLNKFIAQEDAAKEKR